MKIKRLEITGFKSFVENTSLLFDEGVTAVVGPNGCGKSNIVDAIRWVMGEQSARNLRGKAMEDVIFGGSENRKPFGMAEVTLILDNSAGKSSAAYREYTELQVTRRLYRNGDSEYLLNKTPCRLLDITELFMDTGIGSRTYSIIEQGKIGMIVNAKPEDRRSLIEEAAGVTKYKARKKSALRKIDATRQNLLRLGDIIAEVKRQMNSLKRQAARAERYKEFREELKSIDLQFALRRYRELAEQGRLAGAATEEKNRVVDQLSQRLDVAELALNQARLEHAEKEELASWGQEQVFSLTSEIQKVEGQLEFGTREIEGLTEQLGRFAAEKREIEQQLEAMQAEEKSLLQGRKELENELSRQQELLVETEDEMGQLDEQERSLLQHLEDARSRLYNLLTEISKRSGQQEEADRRLQALAGLKQRNAQELLANGEQAERLQQEVNQLAQTLAATVSDRDEAQVRRQRLRDQLERLRLEGEEKDALLLTRRDELSRQTSRLESLQQLERSLEGYGRGVKSLLSDPQQKRKLVGVVADVLEVPAEHEAAVEAVLGSKLQTVLADRVDSIEQALDFLRKEEGRCSFLIPGFASTPLSVPVPGTPLADLVKVKAGSEPAVCHLLSGVSLVEDLRPYLAGGLPPGVVLVTPRGDVLTGRGELTGGGRHALDQGMLHKKREIKELGRQVRSLNDEVDTLARKREQVRIDLNVAEEQLRETEADLHSQELLVVDREKDLHSLNQELSRLQERRETLELEGGQLANEETELQQILQDARSGHTQAEQSKVEQEQLVADLNRENQALRLQAEEVRQRLTTAKMALVGLRERDDGLRETLSRLEKSWEQLQQRQVALSASREDAEAKIVSVRQDAERFRQEIEVLHARRVEKQAEQDSLRDRFEQSRQEIEGRESDIRALRTQVSQAREELTAGQLQNREFSLETEHLRESFLDRYRLDLEDPDIAAGHDPEFDPEESETRRVSLQKRLEEIGEVNLTAIDEFRELEERFTFLTTQQTDLLDSLEGLQAAIGKINRTTRKRFREAFDQINATFRETFPRMFNGGQAELRLTDEHDLLETGIDIVAQPPGKKLQNVSLLSGGEKALTAVALIFSIFQIKPSPFCLLDEVDAPLDDVNIGRFNEIVKQMTADSQFIIITHNKQTMEIADNLYGVTMEDPGVSKLVSVRMRKAA